MAFHYNEKKTPTPHSVLKSLHDLAPDYSLNLFRILPLCPCCTGLLAVPEKSWAQILSQVFCTSQFSLPVATLELTLRVISPRGMGEITSEALIHEWKITHNICYALEMYAYSFKLWANTINNECAVRGIKDICKGIKICIFHICLCMHNYLLLSVQYIRQFIVIISGTGMKLEGRITENHYFWRRLLPFRNVWIFYHKHASHIRTNLLNLIISSNISKAFLLKWGPKQGCSLLKLIVLYFRIYGQCNKIYNYWERGDICW